MAGVGSSSSLSDIGDIINNETFDDADELAIIDTEELSVVQVNDDDDDSEDSRADSPVIGAAMEAMDFEERFKDKPHPLLIDSVVNEICSYLAMKDLENVRAVSRLWNKEACNILRKTRTVELVDLDSVARYVKRMGRTVYFPHASFQLWSEDISSSELNMVQFFHLFGSHIKSLDFQQLSLEAEQLLEILATKVPGLESLTLHTLPRHGFPALAEEGPQLPQLENNVVPEEVEEAPAVFSRLRHLTLNRVSADGHNQFLMDLITACPNLERLTLTKPANSDSGATDGTILLELILNLPCPLQRLSMLDFNFRLKEDNIEPLIRKRYPLTGLDIIMESGVKARSFKNLCSSLRQSLQSLCITFPEKSPVARALPAAELGGLVGLSLTGYKGSLQFIEDMPGLRRLNLGDINLDLALPLRGFQKLSDHDLTHFKCGEDASDRDVVARVSWCFPRLTSLHLNQLGDEGLGVIYRELPFIMELVLTNGTFTDSGISGVPAEVCNDLWETMTIFDVIPERFRRDLFIGSLPHLRRAKLESEHMTDLAIMFGLVSCSKLVSLTLKSSKITDISMPTVGDKMRENLTFLDVIHCPEITEAGRYILKQKLSAARLVFEPPPPSSSRPIRRVRQVDLAGREADQFGLQRDRLEELARARAIELRVAIRIYHQLNVEGQLPVLPARRHYIIRQILRRNPNRLLQQHQLHQHAHPHPQHPQQPEAHAAHQPPPENLNEFFDHLHHLDHRLIMEQADMHDNALDAVALAAAAAVVADEMGVVQGGQGPQAGMDIAVDGAMGGVAGAVGGIRDAGGIENGEEGLEDLEGAVGGAAAPGGLDQEIDELYHQFQRGRVRNVVPRFFADESESDDESHNNDDDHVPMENEIPPTPPPFV